MPRIRTLALAGAALGAVAPSALAAPTVPAELPVYRTVATGVGGDQQLRFLALLGVEAHANEAGLITFLDPERFGAIPTVDAPAGAAGKDEGGMDVTARAIDVRALKALTPLPDEDALARVRSAVEGIQLALPKGAYRIGHTMAGVRSKRGLVAQGALDTTVSYRMSLAGRPLIGPGAKLRVSLDGQGRATQAQVAAPELEPAGSRATIPLATATRQLRATLGACDGSVKGIRLAPSVVYYAAAPGEGRDAVLPFYAFRASGIVDGRRLALRTSLLPAVQGVAPRVSARAAYASGVVRGTIAAPRGGAAPYAVTWMSCATGASGSGREVAYRLRGRGRLRPQGDLLLVSVVDANGVRSTARVKVAVPAPVTVAPPPSVRRVSAVGPVDVGIDYIGVSGGLPGSAVSASGLRSTFASKGVPTAFTWGDSLAWESDFRSADALYVDNVDLEFYTGHANGDGWVTSPSQGDGFVSTGEARLGDRDLEWLGIAACGPLEGIQTGDLSRWLSTFDGLHQLMGYATVTYDNTIEGPHLASYLTGDPGGIFGIGARPPYKVWQSWAQMAIDAQGPSEIWGTMGVTGPGWTADVDEYFWGRGPTGPDIRASQRTGWWWIWGTA